MKTYEELVSKIAEFLAQAGEGEKQAARDIIDGLRRDGLAIVHTEAQPQTCKTIASTIWKEMSSADAEKVAPQIYRDMVCCEDLIKK